MSNVVKEIEVRRLVVGPLATNAYVIRIGDCCIVVDPGDESRRILKSVEGLRVEYVVATHAHFDHVGAVGPIVESTGAKFVLHKDDIALLNVVEEQARLFGLSVEAAPPEPLLVNGGELVACGETLLLIHTPGHTMGSMSILIHSSLFSGDTLFRRGIGRVDLGGNFDELLSSVCKKLYDLPETTQVLPGHGPQTTIGEEKLSNPLINERTCRELLGRSDG